VLNNTADKLNNLSNDVEQTKQLDDRVKKLEAAAESIQHKIKKVNIKKEEEFSSKVDDAVNEIEELLK
jgi:archaellum component FlaC